jgi:DNA-dependent protein kinase catalytic subunit
MCQYVLGIGDRHLSNFMVDLESGGIVGIDFGHNFGTATQVRGCLVDMGI